MQTSDWVLAASTLLGPILAVQAQKYLDSIRQRGIHKDWIFHTLMAHRSARTNPDAVRAFNTIELAFYGTRFFGALRQNAEEKRVVAAWRDFHRHLNPMPRISSGDPREPAWVATSNELFANLLRSLAVERGYELTTDVLQEGGYLPTGTAEAENEWIALRRALLLIAEGKRPLLTSQK
jgi:hypothetical protein